MQLNKFQKNIIFSKPHRLSAIRGNRNTGKSTTALHRIIFLKNNYCLYEEDKILLIVKEKNEEKKIEELYNNIMKENSKEYFTLFTSKKNNLDISNMDDLTSKFLIKDNLSKITLKTKYEILESILKELKGQYPFLKILKKDYTQFFLDELSWIKACEYDSMEVYQQVQRKGRMYKDGQGPYRLLKSSIDRSIIYDMFTRYENTKKRHLLVDKDDEINFAKLNCKREYSHLLVDNAERLTKNEIEFLNNLNFNKTYSSNTFIIDSNEELVKNSWFIKGRKIDFKSYVSKEEFSSYHNKLENFVYHDLKHRNSHNFSRDPFDVEEIIENEEIHGKAELKAIPVYNEIAAGEPMYINDEFEDNFYLPEVWVKGKSDCFILKIKGDSMIGANIEDGDQVVINKSYAAQNNDIIAVNIDGSATLKRLNITKNGAVLLPENEKYSPIYIHEEGASIIGVAVGIIKMVHNKVII